MDREMWSKHYKRLAVAFNKPVNGEQAAIYFTALESLPGAIVALAVDDVIKNRPHWPHASDIREKATSILAGKEYTPPECERCGGNGWVDAESRQSNGHTYQTVRRCPLCRPRTLEPAA